MNRLWKKAALVALFGLPLMGCAAGPYDRGYGYNTSGYRERVDEAYQRGDISAQEAWRAERRADRIDNNNERSYYRERYGN
ncbi:hypothetical protein [Roseiterribacter gracilis]|uniref:Lipoprotein n=1 Tax=Roseiterribacter gracilis TaxID=2812848 RepID=A0A8S8XBG4_9PROT|nr:hypothetical protein TMPK1_35550 [Rhodospirillales bacterium TMPK1]